SKQIIQTNHALRRGTMLDRSVFMGNDVKGRTIGIVGIGNVGRRVAQEERPGNMEDFRKHTLSTAVHSS
ncbi:MAG TPA: NAD(P)-dependent oxidoreductase, partial [Stellaceae bacterium]|nr:NAD(P)-dependent oxidoreductase [Stellaceae bacterium]